MATQILSGGGRIDPVCRIMEGVASLSTMGEFERGIKHLRLHFFNPHPIVVRPGVPYSTEFSRRFKMLLEVFQMIQL